MRAVTLSSALDVLAAATSDLEQLLSKRPVDIGLCQARIADLGSAVRRLAPKRSQHAAEGGGGSSSAGPGTLRSTSIDLARSFHGLRSPSSANPAKGTGNPADAELIAECPGCLVSAAPTFLGFLRWALNNSTAELRALENMVVNLLFQVWVWLPRFNAELSSLVVRNLSFLIQAARLQLGPLESGAAQVHGLPPLANDVASSAPLSVHDDYLWLATVALTKLDTASVETWLGHGAGAPQAERFARAAHGAAVKTLLFASLRLYESTFSAVILEPRRPVFPVPSIDPVVRVAPEPKTFVFGQNFRAFFARAAWVGSVVVRLGTISAASWIDGVRLLTCATHALLRAELLTAADENIGDALRQGGASLAAVVSSPRFSRGGAGGGASSQERRDTSPPPRPPPTEEQALNAPQPSTLRSLPECISALGDALLATGAANDEGNTVSRIAATAAQLSRLALFLAVNEGLRKVHGKAPSTELSRLARDLIRTSRFMAAGPLEVSLTAAMGEVLTMQFEMAPRYTTCETELYEAFLHVVDLLVDAHAPLQTDLARHVYRTAGQAGDADRTASRDDAWRSVLKAAVLLVEAHNPSNKKAAHSWWNATLFFLRSGSGPKLRRAVTQGDGPQRGTTEPVSNDGDTGASECIPAADTCLNTAQASAASSWVGAEEWRAAAATHQAMKGRKRYRSVGGVTAFASTGGHRTWEVATLDRSASFALVCFEQLLRGVIQRQVPNAEHNDAESAGSSTTPAAMGMAAEYCESLATVGDTVHLPPQVVAHLLRGAMAFYSHAGDVEASVRVGVAAEGLIRTVVSDLPFAATLRNEIAVVAA